MKNGVIEYHYGIPKAHGGDSEDNVRRLQGAMADLRSAQPWVADEELIHIAKRELFPDAKE